MAGDQSGRMHGEIEETKALPIADCRLPIAGSCVRKRHGSGDTGNAGILRLGRSLSLRMTGVIRMGGNMRHRYTAVAIILVGMLLACGPKKPFAQAKPSAVDGRRSTTVLRCGALLDVKSGQVRRNVPILIKGNKIDQIGLGTGESGSSGIPVFGKDSEGAETIDLSQMTCLPGLIDTHTHVLLQGDITAEDYDVQLLKQSNPYRAIVGAATAGNALNYGFTTLRDLETEGAGYSDVDIKKAINNGIVPGPRMQVVTRALNVTGAYPLQGYNW